MITFDGLTQEQRDIRRAKQVLKAVMRASGKAVNDELTIVVCQIERIRYSRECTDEHLAVLSDSVTRCAAAATALLESAQEPSVIR